jgi:hypothetical protein
MKAGRGLMIEAALVLGADGAAAAMDAALAPLGYALKPLARAHLQRRGVVRATLVWRCRGRGSSTMLNVTLRLAGLA